MKVSKNFNIRSYGLVLLVTLNAYNIFFSITRILSNSNNTTSFIYFNVVILFISILIYSFTIIKSGLFIFKNEIIILICTLILIGLYLITYLRYGYLNEDYFSYFLNIGVRLVPAVLLGMSLKSDGLMNILIKWIQPFMIFFTLLLFTVIFIAFNTQDSSLNTVGVFNFSGLTYQGLSYSAIIMFALNMFVIFNYSEIIALTKSKFLYSKYINYIFILIQLSIYLFTGGRGATILLFVLVIFFIIAYMNIKKSFLILISVTLFLYVFLTTFTGIAGIERIFSLFTSSIGESTRSRILIYSNSIESIFNKPIFGHGLGSVFYEVGIYSHNVFLDLLLEGGILLTIFMMLVIIYVGYTLIKSFKKDYRIGIFIILYINSFTRLLFSGYYLVDVGFWFVISVVISRSKFGLGIKFKK